MAPGLASPASELPIPASIMALLDARAWWMPRWLEPIVLHLQLEGSTAPAAPAPSGPAETTTTTETETETASGAWRRPSAK